MKKLSLRLAGDFLCFIFLLFIRNADKINNLACLRLYHGVKCAGFFFLFKYILSVCACVRACVRACVCVRVCVCLFICLFVICVA